MQGKKEQFANSNGAWQSLGAQSGVCCSNLGMICGQLPMEGSEVSVTRTIDSSPPRETWSTLRHRRMVWGHWLGYAQLHFGLAVASGQDLSPFKICKGWFSNCTPHSQLQPPRSSVEFLLYRVISHFCSVGVC